LVEVEALRYLNLQFEPTPSPESTFKFNRILICGEYSCGANEWLLRQVSNALDLVTTPCTVILRSHPAGPTPKRLDPRILIDLHSTAFDAITASTIVVSGALSTVSVEASCLGKPVLLVVDPDVIATSPAEGLPGVEFIPTAGHLAQVINLILDGDYGSSSTSLGVFQINMAVPQWRGLVSSSDHSPRSPSTP